MMSDMDVFYGWNSTYVIFFIETMKEKTES